MKYERALIVGAGAGLSASLARLFSKEGMRVAVASRHPERLAELCAETGAKAFGCDAAQPAQVAALFSEVEKATGAPDEVVYNASYRTRGPVVGLDAAEVECALDATAYGGFPVAATAARERSPQR